MGLFYTSTGINLAATEFGAQEMCKGPGLKLLMRRAISTVDPLLLKLLRNISQHGSSIKKLFLVYNKNVSDFVIIGEKVLQLSLFEVSLNVAFSLTFVWLYIGIYTRPRGGDEKGCR